MHLCHACIAFLMKHQVPILAHETMRAAKRETSFVIHTIISKCPSYFILIFSFFQIQILVSASVYYASLGFRKGKVPEQEIDAAQLDQSLKLQKTLSGIAVSAVLITIQTAEAEDEKFI